MKNKNMERMEKQETTGIEALFGRLLDRQMFPWENKPATFREVITNSSQSKAKKTLVQLRRSANVTTNQVIEKIKGRAETWNYTEYLDHMQLWETSP